MKAKSKNNSNTFQGWLEAQLWNASLQPRSMVGAGNAVKGRDQLRCASPLTAFPAQCPRLSRFSLDTAVVVIDRMTRVDSMPVAINSRKLKHTFATVSSPKPYS